MPMAILSIHLTRSTCRFRVHAFVVCLFTLVSVIASKAQSGWVESNAGLFGAHAAAVAFDSLGRPLVGTACGLYRLDGGRWNRILAVDSVAAIVVTPNGSVLAGTHSGVWRLAPSAPTFTAALRGERVTDLAIVGPNRVLAARNYRAIISDSDGEYWSSVEDLSGTNVSRFTVAPDGDVYCWHQSIEHSTDSGMTWETMTRDVRPVVMVSLGGGRLLASSVEDRRVSSDHGRTWVREGELPAYDLRHTMSGDILASIMLRSDRRGAQSIEAGLYRLDEFGEPAQRLRAGPVGIADRGPGGSLIANVGPDMTVSTDGGASWSIVNDGLDCASFGDLTIDRSGAMYGLLRGVNWTTRASTQAALYRSADSGRSWRRLRGIVDDLLGAWTSGEVLAMTRDSLTGVPALAISSDQGVTWRDRPAPSNDAYASGNDSGATAVSFLRNFTTMGDSSAFVWISRDSARTYVERSFGAWSANVLITETAVVVEGALDRRSLSGTILRSIDGLEWTRAVPAGVNGLMYAATNGDLYAIAYRLDRGLDLWRSTDGGLEWSRSLENPDGYLGWLRMAPAGVVFARITSIFEPQLRSTDRGETWQELGFPFDYGNELTATSDGRLYGIVAHADSLVLYESYDLGETWRRLEVPPPPKKYLTTMSPWGELFASTAPARLLRLQRTASSVDRTSPTVGVRLSIVGEPTSDQVTINVSVSTSDALSASIVDLLGRTILTQHRFVEAGNAHVSFDLRSIPNGVYIVSVRAAGFDGTTQPFVLRR